MPNPIAGSRRLVSTILVMLIAICAGQRHTVAAPCEQDQKTAEHPDNVHAGYGPALAWMTRELFRLMRNRPVTVVWLFDESESMKDDQHEVRKQLAKVYEELGQLERSGKFKRDMLKSAVCSFGSSFRRHSRRPTSDISEIRRAMNKIPVDPSGVENTFQAVFVSIRTYARLAANEKRQLAVVVVTDEAGDDGQQVEQAIRLANRAKAPVYFLSRSAPFGARYSYLRWIEPRTRRHLWLATTRGPETPLPEVLQWDGFGPRQDFVPSGFGPYEQVRLARETNGAFLSLPGEEESLSVRKGRSVYGTAFQKHYRPELVSRAEYTRRVRRSQFRSAIQGLIVTFNPRKDRELTVRRRGYPIQAAEFRKAAARETKKAIRALQIVDLGIANLEKVKKLQVKESSRRWRANFDLAVAECAAIRLRLIQFLLAVDRNQAQPPSPKSASSQVWNVVSTRIIRSPDPAEFGRLKAALKLTVSREQFAAEWKAAEAETRRLLEGVTNRHPETPWTLRARRVLRSGFGVKLVEGRLPAPIPESGRQVKKPKL